MVQIRKEHRVSMEEHRCVISDKIPVAFISIKFQREPANITHCICCAPSSSRCRKTREHFCLSTYLGENTCFCILGNGIGDGKCSVGTCRFRMHSAFRDNLTVKMSHLVPEPNIL